MVVAFVNRHIRFPFFGSMPPKILKPDDRKVSIQAHLKSVVCDSPCSDLAEAWIALHNEDHKRLTYKAQPIVLAKGAPPIPPKSPPKPPKGKPAPLPPVEMIANDQNTQWAKFEGNLVGLWLEHDLIPAVANLGLIPSEMGVRVRWDPDGLVPLRGPGERGEKASTVSMHMKRGSEDALRYGDNPLAGTLRLSALKALPAPTTRERAELEMLGALARAKGWK